ncbi:MAG: DUF5110 domain-containing protein [Calditrichaeota bacterium]|nr:DUF5110 domain-containing protein [Calditrichota bacterium]MCB9367198.1 DUF5110 domain-containing protein [Calditrichota bacterium]
MDSIAPTERGARIFCTDSTTLDVQFYTPDIVRITLARPGDPEPLLTDALLADSSMKLSIRWIDTADGDADLLADQYEYQALRHIEENDDYQLRWRNLGVVCDKDSLRLRFTNQDGSDFLADDPAMSYGWDGNEVRTWKKLAPGEKFFGLGEKGGGLDRRGRELVLWNSDTPGYTDSSDPLYQSVPFYIGVRDGIAYGVFFNNSYKTRFNFGAGQQRYSSFAAEDGPLDYFVIYGPTIKAVVQRYTDLTGKMELPPLWALGYQQCRWSYYPESEVRNLAATFRAKDIPCDVIYLDIHYMDGYRVFTWDSTRFPQPKTMISDLAKDGFKIVPIIDPGVKADTNYRVAREGLTNDYFVKYPDGTTHIGDVWPGFSYFPDFSNPATRDWWGGNVAELRKQGLRGFWNDMNEPACWGQAFPLETVFNDNGLQSSHKKMHNLYALQMAQATREGLLKAFPNERPFILTRAGFAGIQRYSASWTGDNLAREDHLELGIRIMLGMGLSGQPFTGMDIGGFMETPSPELYARWIEVGALSPFCRTHTHYGSPDQEPWSFGENIEDISRKFLKFRYELLPYLYTLFYESSKTGEPVWRPLFYEFQNDPTCYDWGYQQQFMLGENILLAPVTRVGQYTKKIYLPEGSWLDWNTKRVYEGNQEIIVDAHLDWLPLFLRNGTILFRRDAQSYADERPIQELTLDVFSLPRATDGFPASSASLYEDDGQSMAYAKGKSRTSEYSYSGQNGAFTLRRTVKQGGFTPPDRKLSVTIHGFGKAPLMLWLNEKQITLADQRVSYDPERKVLELNINSEASFNSLQIETHSPNEE